MVVPLKDNVRTLRLPIVTIILILVNVGLYFWQVSAPTDSYSSPALEQLQLNERDERTIKYGAIPYRLHPGEDCAAGVTEGSSGPQADLVCEGTAAYDRAKVSGQPFQPLDEAPWLLTAFTSMFVHAGLPHIVGNMLFLWIFGDNVEDRIGHGRYLVFYLLCGLVAATPGAARSGLDRADVGATGAVAGVLGAYLVLFPSAHPHPDLRALLRHARRDTGLGPVGGLVRATVRPRRGTGGVRPEFGGGVAYFAHVGGFLFGLAAVKLFALRRPDIGAEPPPPPSPAVAA